MLKIDDGNEMLRRSEVLTYLYGVNNNLIALQRTLIKQNPNLDFEEAFEDLFPAFDTLIYALKMM